MAEQREPEYLTRRGFIAALAASVVAAGAPLPIGMPGPNKTVSHFQWKFKQWELVETFKIEIHFADKATEDRARRECPHLFPTPVAIQAA